MELAGRDQAKRNPSVLHGFTRSFSGTKALQISFRHRGEKQCQTAFRSQIQFECPYLEGEDGKCFCSVHTALVTTGNIYKKPGGKGLL